MSFLRVNGNNILDESNQPIFLRGVSFGSWLNLENFMLGFPGTELKLREAVRHLLGDKAYDVFFQSYQDCFINEEDFIFLNELGVNFIRIPFNYRLFEQNSEPGNWNQSGFYYLDKAVQWAKKYKIYIALDLHAAPGWQNFRWHSDNPFGVSLLWHEQTYIERGKSLWKFIAEHYRDEPQIAGYELINEPEAPNLISLRNLYCQWIEAIRSTGDQHIIFLEGNCRGEFFEGLDQIPEPNIVFSTHNYNNVTLNSCNYPGPVGGVHADKAYLERLFHERNKWLLEHNVPSWIGEFSILFDGTPDVTTLSDESKLQALKDQIEIFNRYKQHWTIWSYKDLQYVGILGVPTNSEYRRRITPVLKIQRELSLNPFVSRKRGGLFTETSRIIDRVIETVTRELNDFSLDYNSLHKDLGEQSICNIIGNLLVPLYVNQFKDLTLEGITSIMQEAFSFTKCVKRNRLVEILKESLKQ